MRQPIQQPHRSATPRGTLVRNALCVTAVALVFLACGRPDAVSPEQRRILADSLEKLVVQAYDFSQPDVATRIMSLYPDSGRVISASAGHISTTRDTLAAEVAGFWQRVGQNMKHPQFRLGSSYVDVLSADAVVMTFTYRIPHMTPAGANHVVEGAWTALWRRQGGRWMIVQEHLSDTPQSTETAPLPADSASMPMAGHVMPPK